MSQTVHKGYIQDVLDVLKEHTDSHSITAFEIIAEDLRKRGWSVTDEGDQVWLLQVPDRSHSFNIYTTDAKSMRESIERRGLGGWFDPGEFHHFVAGWIIAGQFARELIGFSSTKGGRGSAYYDCIMALSKATEVESVQ